MENTKDEYEKIRNMKTAERREYLKNKTSDFKTDYYKYENAIRSRLHRQSMKEPAEKPKWQYTDPSQPYYRLPDNNLISTDPILSQNGVLFRQVADNFFNKTKPDDFEITEDADDIINNILKSPDETCDEINEIIELPEVYIAIPENIPKKQIINAPKTPKEQPLLKVPDAPPPSVCETLPSASYECTINTDNKVVYADTIIAKNYIVEDYAGGKETNIQDINNIKNYNIKLPVAYLDETYINMPNHSSSYLRCDGEYVYIFF